MSVSVPSALCGTYELVAQRDGALRERADGALELTAEDRYLVRLPPGVEEHELRGALMALRGASEGTLQFGNFVGEASLGGRRLVIGSNRLDAAAVQAMLDEVAGQLGSLPFTDESPTSAPYVRDRALSPDALYHAFVLLRDSLRAGGRHDVPSAITRIFARPHETLQAGDAQLVPLGQASHVDAATILAIESEPELLAPVPERSPLAGTPLARHLNGRLPQLLRVRPLSHTTDNRENRFVVAALDTMRDVALQFERLARAQRRPSRDINARDATAIAAQIDRWQRHPTLDALGALSEIPLQSTVLRGRAGYRELLRFYLELIARTRLDEPHELRTLLELRDAADIYECWCFFRVVATVAEVVDAAPKVTRFAVDSYRARVPWGYRAKWPEVDVTYNRSYSRPGVGATPQVGVHSYSLRLRPDITLLRSDGALHLFDAKLKVKLDGAFDAEGGAPDARPDTFKPEDLHKMHAYRDALGARSVWILYPGADPAVTEFPAPWDGSLGGFVGVGAVPLCPGAEQCGGLGGLVASLLEQPMG